MNNSKNNPVIQYLAQVKKNTPSAYRATLLPELQSSIEGYAENHSINIVDDLNQVFGSPEHYISEYLSSMDSSSLSQKTAKQKSHFKLLLAVMSFLLIILITSFAWIMTEGLRHSSGYYEITITDESTGEVLSQQTIVK